MQILRPALLLLATLSLQAGCAAATTTTITTTTTTLYVDCAAPGSIGGDGSRAAPLNNLEALSARVLQPGSRIRFKRGSVCYGSFRPAAGSSGREGAPIVVDSYGARSLPRPVIAAGCRDFRADPLQQLSAAHRTAQGISPYVSLCRAASASEQRAALHLFNVDHWEIRDLELSNDGVQEGGRVGLLVQLENFGVGQHYRIDNVYVHHVHGYLQDRPGQALAYKATGGILFEVTRQDEMPDQPGQPTRFADVLIENSEVFHVDGIGISNRSAWMCRAGGAPCGDYPPYKNHGVALRDQEFFPTTGLHIRNNRVHDIGGDGIIVRTAQGPVVASNLVYDIWMRAPGNSAGVWAINTDEALFQYNEVHGVRLQAGEKSADGMAFDADMGTRNTRIVANYSHDNAGGLVLFCACGQDGLGHQAMVTAAVVENNLSLNDGRRAILVAGLDDALVRANLIVSSAAVALLEVHDYPTPDRLQLRENVVVNRAGAGYLLHERSKPAAGAAVSWQANMVSGYGDVPGNLSVPMPAARIDALLRQWQVRSGFRQHAYRQRARP